MNLTPYPLSKGEGELASNSKALVTRPKTRRCQISAKTHYRPSPAYFSTFTLYPTPSRTESPRYFMAFDLLAEPIRRYVRDQRWEALRPI